MKSTYTKIAALALLALPMVATAQYAHDDGTGENNVGLGAGGDFLWLNEFVVTAGMEVITSLDVAFGVDTGTPGRLDGLPVDLYIWTDPTNDGDPGDATVVSTLNSVVIDSENDNFANYDLPDVTLTAGDNFFVGVLIEDLDGTDFAARMDQTATQGRSWAAFGAVGAIDVNNIGGTSTYGVIDSFGIPGNWMVRANASAVPEPATMIALGLGAAALLRRRRK